MRSGAVYLSEMHNFSSGVHRLESTEKASMVRERGAGVSDSREGWEVSRQCPGSGVCDGV